MYLLLISILLFTVSCNSSNSATGCSAYLVLDECNNCVDIGDECVQDCSGVWGGDAFKLDINGEFWYNTNIPVYGIQFDIEGEDIGRIIVEDIEFNNSFEMSSIHMDNSIFTDRIRFLIFNLDSTPVLNIGTGILLNLGIAVDTLDIRLEDLYMSGQSGSQMSFDNLNNCNNDL